jgi:putative oxidoreductase
MTFKTAFSWVLRLLVSIILLQTLYYKFTAHPDSIYIFSQLGVEPWGRIGLGIIELFTAILILGPRTKYIGMILSLFIIIGAVFSHLLVIGFNIHGDGGGLFSLALIIFISDILFFMINWKDFIKSFNRS